MTTSCENIEKLESNEGCSKLSNYPYLDMLATAPPADGICTEIELEKKEKVDYEYHEKYSDEEIIDEYTEKVGARQQFKSIIFIYPDEATSSEWKSILFMDGISSLVFATLALILGLSCIRVSDNDDGGVVYLDGPHKAMLAMSMIIATFLGASSLIVLLSYNMVSIRDIALPKMLLARLGLLAITVIFSLIVSIISWICYAYDNYISGSLLLSATYYGAIVFTIQLILFLYESYAFFALTTIREKLMQYSRVHDV